jgi:hypothetical protein
MIARRFDTLEDTKMIAQGFGIVDLSLKSFLGCPRGSCVSVGNRAATVGLVNGIIVAGPYRFVRVLTVPDNCFSVHILH